MSARYLHCLTLAVSLLICSSANAQLFRAYLASDGSDANPCTLPAPCRLLPAALNAVASAGEIWMLDSANYNTSTVTINKSVSILAVPGVVGSVVATSGPAIGIAASGLTVSLRNLVIVRLPESGGGTGILMNGASSLSVEDSVFANIGPFAAIEAFGNGRLMVTGSVFRNNAHAIVIRDGIRAQIAGTRMFGNGIGVYASGSTASRTRATVSDCIISGDTGVQSYADAADASVAISVTRSTIGNATYALRADSLNMGAAEVIVGSSNVHNSVYRWYKSGSISSIASYGNNEMKDYSTQLGSLTIISPE